MSKLGERLWPKGHEPRIGLVMKRLLVLALVPVLASPVSPQKPEGAPKKLLTLSQALGQGRRLEWYGSRPRVRWAPDGVHYVLRKGDETVWVDPATGEEKPSPERGGRGEARGASARRPGRRGGRGRGPRRSPSLRIKTESSDKAWTSFVRDNNLVVVNKESKEEWKVTTDGSKKLLYGVLDWVYQEEVYGRGNYRGHWWSGDSQKIAFLRLDESEVKSFTIVDHVPAGFLDRERSVVAENTIYPKAGDPNPKVQLKICWPKEKGVISVDLSGYDESVLIVRVGWTPDNKKLLFAVQDRIQTWMDLNTADPKTGAVEKILREESDTWVNRLPFPRWQADGSFLWFSDRTGYRHIYHYEANGKLRRQLTSGVWQVRSIARVGKGWIWFTGTKDGAINNNLYRVDWQGNNLTRLTQGDGTHSASLNKDGSWFLDTVSSITSPYEVRLCKGDGSKALVVARSAPKDIETYACFPKQSLIIKARDGYPLDASVIKPANFDPDSGKKYPVYLPTYSGPNAPSVRNRFGINTWQQFLAQHGVLILQVNVRSASGRGMAHTGLCYKRLGVVELRDLEDAVDHVCKHFAGDPKRVAIDGWSYGGFMAGYALTHSNKFSLGLAGAGVHDWRLYDTIYTERYMSTPQLNKKGYDETSVIKAAKHLSGHLVLMHGTMDDNVHMQNSIQLIYALQRAGKDDFELMLYPKSRHGVRSNHRRRLVWRAIRDNFKLEH